MNSLRRATWVAAFALCVAGATWLAAGGQQPPTVGLLPLRLQGLASQALAETDVALRADMIEEISEAAPADAVRFLEQLLSSERATPVRQVIVNALGHAETPEADAALTRLEAVETDPAVQAIARARLAERRLSNLVEVVGRQAAAMRTGGAVEALAQLEGRLSALESLQDDPPPPVVAAPALAQSGRTRFAVIGDFGTGKPEQFAVADALAAHHATAAFDFALTVGDNFYGFGLDSVTSKRWISEFEVPYGRLGVKFFATLGNHDWDGPGSPEAEIAYSARSKFWSMPAHYYTFTAGPVQLFALDTDIRGNQAQQMKWLADALQKSTAAWKVVYGHHPIYSGGKHGNTARLVKSLLPALKGRAQVYVGGHDHDMQYLMADGVHLVQAGGGGRSTRDVACVGQSIFAGKSHGFATFTATATELDIALHGPAPGAAPLYVCHLVRAQNADGTFTVNANCPRLC